MINLQTTSPANGLVLPATSAFYNTERAKTKTSEKYRVISTSDVAKVFLNNGFVISNYSEQGYKNPDLRGKGAHLVRLRHPSTLGQDNVPEIVLFNAYDGSKSFKINIGIYRFICANGMVVGDSFFNAHVKHIGGTVTEQVNQIIDESYKKFPIIMSKIGEMQNKILTTDQKLELANVAFKLRQKSASQSVTDINLLRNIQPLRQGDTSSDVYTVFNVLQEKVIRGGFEYTKTENDSSKILSFRALKSITDQERVNKQLFDYAMAM